MTSDSVKLPPEARQRVEAYLDAIERVLVAAGMPRDERRGITDEIEAQILEMLADRAGFQPTVSDVEAVLSELDPPEAYAEEPAGASPAAGPAAPPSPAVRPHFSRAAIVGACCMALTFVTLVPLLAIGAPMIAYRALAVEAPESPGGPPAAPSPHAEPAPGARVKWAPVIMVIPLGLALLAGPAATTILGLAAISHIRKSAGRIYGMGLALADALVFPLLALDLLLFVGVCRAAAGASVKGLIGLALGLAAAAVVDVVIVRLAWRRWGGAAGAGPDRDDRLERAGGRSDRASDVMP